MPSIRTTTATKNNTYKNKITYTNFNTFIFRKIVKFDAKAITNIFDILVPL